MYRICTDYSPVSNSAKDVYKYISGLLPGQGALGYYLDNIVGQSGKPQQYQPLGRENRRFGLLAYYQTENPIYIYIFNTSVLIPIYSITTLYLDSRPTDHNEQKHQQKQELTLPPLWPTYYPVYCPPNRR